VPASQNIQIPGVASICWAIWKLRNRACFEGKLINSPIDLICYSVVFIWAGFNSSADQKIITRGANKLINTTLGSHIGASSTHNSNGDYGADAGDGVRRPMDEDDGP
jgi:hypothetical protein